MKNNYIKKNDEVIVISGNEKGKKGKVLSVDHENGRVIVEGVNMATKHKKPRRQGEAGGIIHQEAALNMSNVMHICKSAASPPESGTQFLQTETRFVFARSAMKTLMIN